MGKTRWVTLELFTFTSGIRSAWIVWEKADPLSERRCVGVEEIGMTRELVERRYGVRS